MSQTEETFEFETEMNEQVAAEIPAEPVVEAEPETTETPEVEVIETKDVVEPEESTTDSKEESWTFSQAMDEREKRQKWQKKAEELEEKLKATETTEDDVSIFEDESAWKAKQDEKVQQETRNVALNMSQAFAEEVYGEEKVAEATKWMQDEGVKSPYIVNEFNAAKLPFHKLVKLHEAEQERLNPEAYKAKLKAEILKEIKSEVAAEEPETPIKPSLASKRSAGEPSKFPDNPEDILGD